MRHLQVVVGELAPFVAQLTFEFVPVSLMGLLVDHRKAPLMAMKGGSKGSCRRSGGGTFGSSNSNQATGGRRTAPVSALIRNSTKNTTNSTCAIHAAVPATPEKPNTAAISATIKKVRAQFNMIVILLSA